MVYLVCGAWRDSVGYKLWHFLEVCSQYKFFTLEFLEGGSTHRKLPKQFVPHFHMFLGIHFPMVKFKYVHQYYCTSCPGFLLVCGKHVTHLLAANFLASSMFVNCAGQWSYTVSLMTSKIPVTFKLILLSRCFCLMKINRMFHAPGFHNLRCFYFFFPWLVIWSVSSQDLPSGPTLCSWSINFRLQKHCWVISGCKAWIRDAFYTFKGFIDSLIESEL